jgi:hypothetical protein
MTRHSTMSPAKRARDRRFHYCTAVSAVLAGVITGLLSKRHAALTAATAHSHVSPILVLGLLFFVLDIVLTLVTFTVATIAAGRHRARRAPVQDYVRAPAPRRARRAPVQDLPRRRGYVPEERR